MDVILSMHDDKRIHQITVYNIESFVVEMGGGIFGIYLFFMLITNFFTPEKMVQEFSTEFYRKPELYKYALAEKIPYDLVIKGKMTPEEYNAKVQQVNMDAMNSRT